MGGSYEEDFHDARAEDDPQERDAGDDESQGDSYDWWWQPRGGNSWWSAWDQGWSRDEDWESSSPQLLPDLVQGWFLLHDANLDTGERNMILASLKGDYSYDRVAQELRVQWSDEDVRKRDLHHRGSSLWVDDDADDDFEDEAMASMTMTDDLNEEGWALMSAAQDEIDQALAMVQQGKRTLRDAREKQHQVRMSRKYFRTSFRSSFRDRENSKVNRDNHGDKHTCMRCGGSHRTANCPKAGGQPASMATVPEDQQAPFTCYLDAIPEDFTHDEHHDGEQALAAQGLISTADAVVQGKAVIDGGATRTLASVTALEHIMSLNANQKGHNGILGVDLQDRPTFGFGNSSKDQCLSPASLQISAGGRDGCLKVHTLNRGEGPVLLSVDSLRSLGAMIDFENDLMVLRALNPRKVIALERSSTGHQLLPMTSDWFENATEARQPVLSLREQL